jgi:hypothetical protein
MCNRVLAGSAVAAFLILLTWTVVVQPPGNVLWAIPEFIGKWLLLWTAAALLVGVQLEAAIEVRRGVAATPRAERAAVSGQEPGEGSPDRGMKVVDPDSA